MKVQIFEQLTGGHYTEYIHYLLPTLVRLIDEKLINEVVVTITPKHLKSDSFQHQLSKFSSSVHFDPCLQEVNPCLSLDPRLLVKSPTSFISALQRRTQIETNLINSVHRIKPDYLISTTAETQSSITGSLKSLLGRQFLPKHIRSQGIFHYGSGGTATSIVDTIKDLCYRSMWKHSPWSRLLFVNPLIYEHLKQQGTSFAKRFDLVPNPVPTFTSVDKTSARKALKIPMEGRYIGFIGSIDARVAIPELIAAFRAATSNPTDRLLLAGRILPRYKKLLEEEFKALIEHKRLILIDRYLDLEEINLGYSALDAVSLLYYKRANLSANLLKAVSAQRPAIANDYGYTGMMVKRFDIGWSCDVSDHQALVATLRKSLEACEAYHVNERTSRLIQFHHPDNYAATVLKDLHSLVMPDHHNQPKTWEWVIG
ncbi:MAG: glycosyltransferase [Anaerolineae bacterium]|nr:glycosyltransferase [Gloeobacterales cyanobacterium ES-bin-313]